MPLKEVAKSPLGFYSKVEEATLPLQNKGTGSQYLAQIEKTPGVKPEELEYTGLADFLRSKQTVTKPEIQDYLAANRVDLQEVRLGSGNFAPEPLVKIDNIRVEPEGDGSRWFIESPTGSVLARAGSEEEARQLGVRYFNSQIEERNRVGALDADNTKFSRYTIPGGENYREILLTLPERTRVKSLEEVNDGRSQRGAAPLTQERYDELVARGGLQDYAEGTFKSSHYEQPNILTHLRANDRVIDGKKALFIEEIQSDWHQAGRKKGYGPQTETTHEAYYTTPDGQRVSLGFGATREEAAAAVDSGWKNIVDVKFDTQTRKVSEGVPDAPFKKSWHELALKRAIQEAVDKGYDKLAFTTGKTQAERYDLSKQVSRVVYNEPGSKRADKFGTVLYAYDKNGDQVLNKTVAPNE
jgi:hypothetical protein